MTRISKNIYYDIYNSDIYINYQDLIFYFSSDFNKKRFEDKIINFIKEENMKLKIKYNVEVNFDKMLLISFYKKIEKRGFRVYRKYYTDNEECLINIHEFDIIKSKVGE